MAKNTAEMMMLG